MLRFPDVVPDHLLVLSPGVLRRSSLEHVATLSEVVLAQVGVALAACRTQQQHQGGQCSEFTHFVGYLF